MHQRRFPLLAVLVLLAAGCAAEHSGTPRARSEASHAPDPIHAAMLSRLAARPCNAPAPAVCFDQGTDDATVQAFAHALAPFAARFNQGPRWSATATQPLGTGDYGDRITLTYSFVPDGTPVEGFIGEPDSPSNLFAQMNAIYPAGPSAWQPLFHGVFARWGQLCGITFVFEPNDDGVPIDSADGVLGVRGDLRIAAHPIDGNSRVLAYNFYPDGGDMVLDLPDSFYNNTGNSSIRLRNVVAHEHGHGMGQAHACPVTQTKVMEPFLSTAFDGPQHDDLRNAQNLYGDPLEPNDTPAAATPLGVLAPGSLVLGNVPAPSIANGSLLSLDADTDVDCFAFSLLAPRHLAIEAAPVGLNYEDTPQACPANSASCCTGSFTNSLAIADLALDVLTPAGAVLATRNAAGPGNAETIPALDLPAGAYVLRVRATNIFDQTQLYRLSIDVTSTPTCPADLDDGSGHGTGDNAVDINDLLFFLACFEQGALCADLDDDGLDPAAPDQATDINDLLFFLRHFEQGC